MNDTKTSRYISLILRHKPEAIGAKLDNEGWCDVDVLLKGCNISIVDLERIVKEDNKGRYSFNSDKTKIRANQGHSIKVDLNLKKQLPPDILYHGTSKKYLNSILEKGLVKGERHHVHLSDELDTAFNVGSRRKGTVVIFAIDTKKMINDNIEFYKSENNVWLCDYVSSKYFIKYLEVDQINLK